MYHFDNEIETETEKARRNTFKHLTLSNILNNSL